MSIFTKKAANPTVNEKYKSLFLFLRMITCIVGSGVESCFAIAGAWVQVPDDAITSFFLLRNFLPY